VSGRSAAARAPRPMFGSRTWLALVQWALTHQELCANPNAGNNSRPACSGDVEPSLKTWQEEQDMSVSVKICNASAPTLNSHGGGSDTIRIGGRTSSFAKQARIQRELSELRAGQEDDLQEHIGKVSAKIDELQASGLDVPEGARIVALLGSLPESYGAVAANLDILEEKATYAALAAFVLEEERRQKRRVGTASRAQATRTHTSSGSPGGHPNHAGYCRNEDADEHGYCANGHSKPCKECKERISNKERCGSDAAARTSGGGEHGELILERVEVEGLRSQLTFALNRGAIGHDKVDRSAPKELGQNEAGRTGGDTPACKENEQAICIRWASSAHTTVSCSPSVQRMVNEGYGVAFGQAICRDARPDQTCAGSETREGCQYKVTAREPGANGRAKLTSEARGRRPARGHDTPGVGAPDEEAHDHSTLRTPTRKRGEGGKMPQDGAPRTQPGGTEITAGAQTSAPGGMRRREATNGRAGQPGAVHNTNAGYSLVAPCSCARLYHAAEHLSRAGGQREQGAGSDEGGRDGHQDQRAKGMDHDSTGADSPRIASAMETDGPRVGEQSNAPDAPDAAAGSTQGKAGARQHGDTTFTTEYPYSPISTAILASRILPSAGPRHANGTLLRQRQPPHQTDIPKEPSAPAGMGRGQTELLLDKEACVSNDRASHGSMQTDCTHLQRSDITGRVDAHIGHRRPSVHCRIGRNEDDIGPEHSLCPGAAPAASQRELPRARPASDVHGGTVLQDDGHQPERMEAHASTPSDTHHAAEHGVVAGGMVAGMILDSVGMMGTKEVSTGGHWLAQPIEQDSQSTSAGCEQRRGTGEEGGDNASGAWRPPSSLKLIIRSSSSLIMHQNTDTDERGATRGAAATTHEAAAPAGSASAPQAARAGAQWRIQAVGTEGVRQKVSLTSEGRVADAHRLTPTDDSEGANIPPSPAHRHLAVKKDKDEQEGQLAQPLGLLNRSSHRGIMAESTRSVVQRANPTRGHPGGNSPASRDKGGCSVSFEPRQHMAYGAEAPTHRAKAVTGTHGTRDGDGRSSASDAQASAERCLRESNTTLSAQCPIDTRGNGTDASQAYSPWGHSETGTGTDGTEGGKQRADREASTSHRAASSLWTDEKEQSANSSTAARRIDAGSQQTTTHSPPRNGSSRSHSSTRTGDGRGKVLEQREEEREEGTVSAMPIEPHQTRYSQAEGVNEPHPRPCHGSAGAEEHGTASGTAAAGKGTTARRDEVLQRIGGKVVEVSKIKHLDIAHRCQATATAKHAWSTGGARAHMQVLTV
ncbi:hypothetical protein OC842_007614, partial [Tilletia horrida]